MVDLSIIIVSWNVSKLLSVCLGSILADHQIDVEIIVVDSASTDDTVAMLRTNYPNIQLLTQSENIGFTRSNNLGLKAAKGRYLMLLNPDTEIIGDALTQMVVYMDAHPKVGILGPHTLNTDGSHQSSRRRFPTSAVAFFESTWLQPYAPAALLDRYYMHDTANDAVIEVDWVQGSALLARREVYSQIGGLDEGYIMFSEELDWCKRAKLAGWHVVYLGTAYITHHSGKSTEQVVARRHIHFQASKLRYFRKYHGRALAFVLRLFLMTTYLWQIGLESAKSLLGNKRELRRERVRAYWQILRSLTPGAKSL